MYGDHAIRFSDGHSTSFEAVVNRYAPALTAFATGMIGREDGAKDVVQEVFLNFWSHKQSFADEEHLRRSLYMSVRNGCLNTLRGRRHRRLTVADNDHAASDPALAIMKQEATRLLLEAISALPERMGQVLRLTLQGYSQEEIAGSMGIAVSSVKTMKRSGIEKVRARWRTK